jgi:hypothetical protein
MVVGRRVGLISVIQEVAQGRAASWFSALNSWSGSLPPGRAPGWVAVAFLPGGGVPVALAVLVFFLAGSCLGVLSARWLASRSPKSCVVPLLPIWGLG